MSRLFGMGIADATATLNESPLILFGGAFDPIHNGHLWLAQQSREDFAAAVHLVPNGQPPHRSCRASWRHRLSMCLAATATLSDTTVGEEESPGQARYTIDTLSLLRRRHPHRSLSLLVGGDAFAALPSWRRWTALLELAHIIVVRRPQLASPLDETLRAYCRSRLIAKKDLRSRRHGGIYFWRRRPPSIESRAIRALHQRNPSDAENLLPASVQDYIRQHQLYAD